MKKMEQKFRDTQVREILDPVDPKALRHAFTAAFAAAQRGKALEQFHDCERNAAKRMLHDLRREHPHLDVTIIEDSLSSNAPHIKLLRELNFHFILGVKQGDHVALIENTRDFATYRPITTYEVEDGGIKHTFQFINNIPLNESNTDVLVNYLEYWKIGPGGVQRHFTWVTDFPLTKANVMLISRGGRARWKIENETFNTLKNQGYQFEHNFGHGKQNLSVVFSHLMMLAFLIDQLQELCCPLFAATKATFVNRKAFWEKLRSLFLTVPLASWEQLYKACAFGYTIAGLTVNSA